MKITFPDVPVILGGIYADISTVHAKKYGNADIIFDNNNIQELLKMICDIFNDYEPLIKDKDPHKFHLD